MLAQGIWQCEDTSESVNNSECANNQLGNMHLQIQGASCEYIYIQINT